jgi:hypothetical protein
LAELKDRGVDRILDALVVPNVDLLENAVRGELNEG